MCHEVGAKFASVRWVEPGFGVLGKDFSLNPTESRRFQVLSPDRAPAAHCALDGMLMGEPKSRVLTMV